MNNPKPKIYNNDIKVLGRVVSITSENKVAAAEQIFDEKFKYNELPDYSFDNENIDPTRKGLNQYSINRLIGKKVKDIEDAGLLPDEDGFLNNIKIDNLTVKNGATFSGDVSFGDNVSIDKNLTVGNKITTKDLEVTNNARINKLVVGPGEGIDVYDALTHLLQCCENMNNQGGSGQGGVTLVVSPNPINMNVGDTVEFTVKLNVGGMDLVIDPEINYTASISNTSVATLIGNNKVKAVSGGTTQLTVSWNDIQKTVQINVTLPTPQEPETPAYWTVTYNPNINDDTMQVSTETVEDGYTASGRTLSKDGYTFNGWTLNGSAYNFNTPVHSNITLVGSWTQNEPEQPETHTYQLTLDPTSMNMTVGEETRGIIATRKRDNDVVISDGTINWSSSNTSVATVDWAGTVTAHGQGDATITATWVDPNGETKTATCSVTASVNIVQPTSLKIVGHENVTVDESTKVATIDVTDGSKTVKFKAVITPSNADTDTEITWTKLDGVGEIIPDPNDSSICTYVSLDRSSVCNLKATTANGISDQILIDVVTTAPDPIYPSSIAISGANTVEVGSNITLHATVSPSNADTDNTVTWSSSDQSKATVNNGVVTGVAAGNVVITAATGAGNAITATHNVEITTQSVPVQYTLTPDTNYWEFKIGQNPTTKTIRLTLNGWQSGTQWDLKRSDNNSYNEHTGIDHSDQQVSAAAQADSPTGNPITFSAWIDGSKVAETTVTIVTLPEDEPTHNTFTATFFDTGLGPDETDPYVYGSNPNLEYPVGPSYYDNPVVLGTVDFTEGEPSGVWHNAKEGWPTEEEVKATCLAAGVDRTGYTLRWDSASYAGYMPHRDIYIKAVWDANQYTLTYKDGDTTVDTLTYYTGQTITPTTAEGYQNITWRDMPTDMKMPGHNLTVYATLPFTLDRNELSMIANEHTNTLVARIGGTAITENVTWSSSDSSIASVDLTGLVTALAQGNATITATTTDERAANKTATCSVTVTVRNPRLRHSGGQSTSPTLFVGESVDFIEEVLDGPEGCRLIWSSENSSVCEVSVKEQYLTRDATETITIKAVGEGTATITAALVDSEGNAIMAKNDNNQSYAVRSDVINVTVSADPTVKVTWNTDSNASLTNASSQNGVSEFEPITLDNNGDAEYHDWTADVEVENGYKIKDIKVYRIVSGNPYLADTITDNVSTISITHPTFDMQISITTEAI